MPKAPRGGPAPNAPVAKLGGVPLELLLTAVRGPVTLEVEEQAGRPFSRVRFVVDGASALDLARAGHVWRGELDTRGLDNGAHEYELEARGQSGRAARLRGVFRVRNRAR